MASVSSSNLDIRTPPSAVAVVVTSWFWSSLTRIKSFTLVLKKPPASILLLMFCAYTIEMAVTSWLNNCTELEEAGPEAQVYHEVRSAITALHHLLKGEGYHAAEPHLLEAGARMNQGHHLQEGTACQGQGQGQGHHPEAHLLRKGLCLMEIVLLILTKNTISECVSQLQSDCGYEVKQKALETLISITKASPQNRNLVLQNNEAIPTILNLLKSSPTLEKLSLSTIFNLSLNPNLKSTLAEMATIQHLNTTILSRGSLESARLAASLICSLAMLDKNKAVFGVANTIQVLLMAVSRSKGHATCTSPTKLTCRAGTVPWELHLSR
ncbi:hypothetical protein E3N88_33244 [Mikania micrantha]|uniref:Armadillo repeat-containing domain-containing protein n=1 Tax=Mikania micrantha TaxID=192012 RepID=A0A5N6MAU7_9ASTR|nr:hypothetical protein E3N88_33244 [Mikania micrantha]